MSRICSPIVIGTSYHSLICQDTMALKALYRGLDNLSIEGQEGTLFYIKEVIILISGVEKVVRGLFNRVSELNKIRADSGKLYTDYLSAEDFTGLGVYKRCKVLKQDLYKTKKLTDEIIFCLRKNKILLDSTPAYSLATVVADELKQELECQTFLNGLINLYETDGLRISCSEFIDRLKIFEPKDELICSTAIPWSIYCANNTYLMSKWCKTKRIFNTEEIWLDYITNSYLENGFDNPIPIKDLIKSLPYNNFAISMKVETGFYLVLLDYDVNSGKLYCGGYTGDISEYKTFSSFFTVLDLSKSFSDVLNTAVLYYIVDATSYGAIISPTICRWSVYDFGADLYTGNIDFDNLRKDSVYIPYDNVGRYKKRSIVKPISVSGEYLGDDRFIKMFEWLIKIILTFMIFISSENSSSFISSDRPKVVARKQKAKGKNKQPDIESYTVAEREVAFLKSNNYQYIGGYAGSTGRGKKSHIRRGHWHHYWVGKRDSNDRKLITKFLMPIVVNGDEASDITSSSLPID